MKTHHFLFAVVGLSAVCLQAEPVASNWQAEAAKYPVAVYTGKHAAPKFTPKTREFRSTLRMLQKQAINYGGEYVLDFAGCGTGCAIGLLYNARTGATQFLPTGTVSSCYGQPALMEQAERYYQPNSRLLQIVATMNDADSTGDVCYTKNFIADRGTVRLLNKTAMH
ncbi:hypothetical protein LVJ82_08745 [Vitreoscilla massiliensis]|uniref:DUF306 domain-containing protein n=1 Tax=Vitreoscilla massiliensis TaxID=1689272 RepID=A0ABY4E5I5_9NEIS|nr:hypothetical protein [Vitreoscilla massiliensis]UOO91036.1 hypothetical protein LVJ82_08745 [Vitreoscilla massiliensis]